MTHTPHELSEEFPEFIKKMHDLKMNDAHFTKLYYEYHQVNKDMVVSRFDAAPLTAYTALKENIDGNESYTRI